MKPQEAIDAYVELIRKTSKAETVGDYVKLTVPFLDRHSDYLDLYIREFQGMIELTDDGYLADDLISCGFDMENNAHSLWLYGYWQGHTRAGDTLDGGIITMRCNNLERLGWRIHDLIEGLRWGHHQWISPYEEGGKP